MEYSLKKQFRLLYSFHYFSSFVYWLIVDVSQKQQNWLIKIKDSRISGVASYKHTADVFKCTALGYS